jgi:hypothetical protein
MHAERSWAKRGEIHQRLTPTLSPWRRKESKMREEPADQPTDGEPTTEPDQALDAAEPENPDEDLGDAYKVNAPI